jgi:arylsulfatase A-like enzyme
LARGSRPEDHGFDEWLGFMAGCVDYYSHIFYWGMNQPGPGINPTHDLWHNGREIWRNGEYITDMITREAVSFIRRQAGSGKPFFLYVPYNAPHYPMHAPAEYLDRFRHLPADRRIMAAMISAVDDGVGAIVAELARQRIDQNTCIFFMSDNGPSRETRNWLDGRQDFYYGGTTGRLKGQKFSLFEGGIRVPGIFHWPAAIPAGQLVGAPAAAMDIFPTFLKAAGGQPADHELDGADILPMLARNAPAPDRNIFWDMNGQTAVRRGPWKLVLNGQLVEGSLAEDAVHLSNLDEDMGEQTNLKDKHPQIVAGLKAAAEAWREKIEQRWASQWQPMMRGTTTH